jgi:hypothetical protein
MCFGGVLNDKTINILHKWYIHICLYCANINICIYYIGLKKYKYSTQGGIKW